MEKTAKHQSQLQGKFYLDREVLHAVEFDPSGTFGAIAQAEIYLKDLGYTTGSMCRTEPIGFAYGADRVAKWYNLSEDDKAQLDGIILPEPEFREGGVLILFYTPPRY